MFPTVSKRPSSPRVDGEFLSWCRRDPPLQSFTDELPGSEPTFCGHALHVDDAVAAVTLLYVPAPHVEHVDEPTEL
jgi:hypothetical protein